VSALEEHAPEGYETGIECTHHGPSAVGVPSLFVEVGSDEPQWKDETAARAVARPRPAGTRRPTRALGSRGPTRRSARAATATGSQATTGPRAPRRYSAPTGRGRGIRFRPARTPTRPRGSSRSVCRRGTPSSP
jgi:hypothetical protein